jgi:aspartate/methionine/tyrosine aminotransferase
MNRTLVIPANGNAIPYLYAPDDEQMEAALKTIGTLSSAVMTTPSGTASIACVLFWLASTNVRRLLILSPFYFSVGLLAEALGFDVDFATMQRIANGYALPPIPADIDAIWITNPLYCTTHYFTTSQLRSFRDMLESNIYVIADEPMTFPCENAGSSLAAHRRFIGIYSPHKAIGINGLKCSLVACDESIRHEMLDIFDGLVGGLPLSAMTAISHLISTNFVQCKTAYEQYIQVAYERVRRVVALFPALSLDPFARTNFVSAFALGVPAELGKDAKFLSQACEETAAIAYPAVIHSYGNDCGFGFRVNLTAVNDQLIAALHRWCAFLEYRSLGRT